MISEDIIYEKIKFKSNIYKIGDCLMIRDADDGYLVAKLLKIIQTNGLKQYPFWPVIEVQW